MEQAVAITTEINECHRLARGAAETAVKYAIRCGQLLLDQKAAVKHGEWKPWVEANCDFSINRAGRYMRAAKCAPAHNLGKDDYLAIGREIWGHKNRDSVVTQYTGKGDWKTPPEFADKARQAMGTIDLDPASSVEANKTIKADTIYTEQDDGLNKPWSGNVFVNPPYDSSSVRGFVDKLADEIGAKRVQNAVLLTNNATDTKWWQKAARLSTAICFTSGRINFHDDSDRASNTNGQTFMYFGSDITEFSRAFRDVGFIAVNQKDLNNG